MNTFAPPCLRIPVCLALFAGLLATSAVGKAADSRELQRKIDQAKREAKAQQRLREKAFDASKVRGQGATNRPGESPFNASIAPPPAECLKAFVTAARNASSMDQIMNYLPQKEMAVLKDRQSRYDPKHAAESRQWFKQQNPKLTEADLTNLTNPPYTAALNFHKGVANDIRDILGTKVDGYKATLVVSTNNGATINGEHYPYGEADVEMVGEGNYWKLSRFSPSIMYFKEPPKAP